MFTAGHTDDLGKAPSALSRDEKMRAVTAKTAVHEIGHSFHIGEDDDRSVLEDPLLKFQRSGEIYSGETIRSIGRQKSSLGEPDGV